MTRTDVVLIVVGAVLLLASAYVERHRRSYGPQIRLLAGLAFAGGAAAVVLGSLG